MLPLPAFRRTTLALALGAIALGPRLEAQGAPEPPAAVLVGAGDIAGCGEGYADEATARLIERIGGTVFTAGDNAYPDGATADLACYERSWGRFKHRTYPSPGNHDYQSEGAAPYFAYFGARAGPAGRGYYSYDLGGWHVVALNSERDLKQEAAWLAADLAAHPAACTLAYWHKPLFTSGSDHPPETTMRPIWRVLYDAGAELVISGHNHQYERFGPQDADGRADPARGIRQFVAGTGGNPSLYDFDAPQPNSEVRWNGGHGVLKLTLLPGRYEYEFVSVPGETFTDRGSGSCH